MMKRFLICVLAVLSVSISSGCGGNTDDTSNTENTVKNVETKTNNENNEENKIDKLSFVTEYKIEDAKDGYFIVSKLDGKLYGLIDSKGKEVIPLEYDNINFPESKKANAVIVKTEGKMGLYDYKGKEILPLEYEEILNHGANSNLYLVQKKSVQSLVDLTGKERKRLSGNYDAVINNTFLVIGLNSYVNNEYRCSSAYNFDEQLLYDTIHETAEYNEIICLNNVDGFMKLLDYESKTPHSCLMNGLGEIIFTSSQIDQSYWDIHSLQNNNLFSVLGSQQYMYNVSTGKFSETAYKGIVSADDNTIIASRIDNNADVYDSNGNLKMTIELDAESLIIGNNSSMIIAEYGDTYRIYNDKGNQVSDERFLDAEFDKGFLILQNLDGKYGLMDNEGNMRIPFGEMGENSYNGKKWDETYVFGDTFCIVTENDDGSTVWMF